MGLMRILGLISGTSHDGIDAAVVNFTDRPGGTLAGRIEHCASVPYEAGLRARLIAALPPAPVGFDVACELDTGIGQAFAAAAADALAAHAARADSGPVDAICSHGQTVFHWVDNGRARGTLQLGQPAWIAEATGLPVVSDLRAADIAAGGQGAPLVPVLDRLLLEPFRARGQRAAALNLGGIANLTVCAPGADPAAWDTGPGNALIDAVVTASADTPDTFDRHGALAVAGQVIPHLLAELLAEPYYALPPPKSTGKELFHLGYVDKAMRRADVTPALPDLVATLTELTAVTVADAVRAAGVSVRGRLRRRGAQPRADAPPRRAAARRPGDRQRRARRAAGCQGGGGLRPDRLGHAARPARQRAQLHRRQRPACPGARYPVAGRLRAAARRPDRLARPRDPDRGGRARPARAMIGR